MKLTKSQLKQILKEEIELYLLEAEGKISRRKFLKQAAATAAVVGGGLGVKALAGSEGEKPGLEYPTKGGDPIELDRGCQEDSDCEWNQTCGDDNECYPDTPEKEKEKRKTFSKKYEPKKGQWSGPWGKGRTDEDLDKIIEEELFSVLLEHAKDYVWGVKGPGKVANQYKLKTMKLVLKEGWFSQDDPPAGDEASYRIMNQLINHTRDQYTMMEEMTAKIHQLEKQIEEISSSVNVDPIILPSETTSDETTRSMGPKEK